MRCGRWHGWMKSSHASELHERGTHLSLGLGGVVGAGTWGK